MNQILDAKHGGAPVVGKMSEQTQTFQRGTFPLNHLERRPARVVLGQKSGEGLEADRIRIGTEPASPFP